MTMTTTARCAFGAMALVGAGLLAGCADTPKNMNPRADAPLTYANVDLPRYMGKWYLVAHIPYFLEKGLVGSNTRYTLNADGKTVTENFSAYKGTFGGEEKKFEFTDTPDPTTGNAYWSVRLFWPVYVSQATLYVDDAYQYTLIGYKDKSLGWVFSRTPDLPEAKYQEFLKRFEEQGYDASRFRRIPQKPDQIGQPGYDPVE